MTSFIFWRSSLIPEISFVLTFLISLNLVSDVNSLFCMIFSTSASRNFFFIYFFIYLAYLLFVADRCPVEFYLLSFFLVDSLGTSLTFSVMEKRDKSSWLFFLRVCDIFRKFLYKLFVKSNTDYFGEIIISVFFEDCADVYSTEAEWIFEHVVDRLRRCGCRVIETKDVWLFEVEDLWYDWLYRKMDTSFMPWRPRIV